MCTSWNDIVYGNKTDVIITYWEMCTSWNVIVVVSLNTSIITYWEMCTSWNTKNNVGCSQGL